jgi:pectate lyase
VIVPGIAEAAAGFFSHRLARGIIPVVGRIESLEHFMWHGSKTAAVGVVFFTLICAIAVATSAATSTPDFNQIGFSTVNALGDDGTTGGGNKPPIIVHNAHELQIAVERTDIKIKSMRQNTPRVVLIANDIDMGELKNTEGGTVLKDIGTVRVASFTTIYADGPGVTIRHGTLDVHGAHNVIIRNLIFRDLWEYDPTGKYDKLGWDSIRLTRESDVYTHHVWIDHCDFGKVYDGQIDIVHGSDFVTVSWCKFAGDERGPQKKVSLVGHSPNNAAEDMGRLNVTFHHNWYENIDDRAPRVRFGNVHSFDNYINGAENATICVCGAVTLVEDNYYNDAKIATTFSHAKDTVAKERAGTIALVDCINANPRTAPSSSSSNENFERDQNFKSNVERDKLKFNEPAATFDWPDRSKPPYVYTVDPVADVPELVKQNCGTGKFDVAAWRAAAK